MTTLVCGKVWKYLGVALRARPAVAVSFTFDGAAQEVELWSSTSKVTLRFDRTDLTVRRDAIETARLSLTPTPPASAVGAAVIGAALDEHRGNAPAAHRDQQFAAGRGRLRALHALFCFAQATQSPVENEGVSSWRAGPLVFSPSGVVRDTQGKIFDVGSDAVAAVPAAALKEMLQSLARGEAVEGLAEVQSWWRIKCARKAFFPPHAPKHVVVEQPDTHLTFLNHVEMGRNVLSTHHFAGPCVLWTGAAASWFIAADGRAMRFSRNGDLHSDPLDFVDTGLRAQPWGAGFDRPLLAAGHGFMAFVDGNNLLRCVFEEPAATPAGLCAQVNKLLAAPGLAHEKLGAHHVPSITRAGELVFATTPGWQHLIFDPSDGSWRWTEVATDTLSHPKESLAHPSGTPVAVLQSGVTIFDVDNGRHVATISFHGSGPVIAADWSRDGQYLVMLRGLDLFALRVASMQLRHLLTIDETRQSDSELPPQGAVAFSSTGEFLFASQSSMSIFPWARLIELFRRGDDLPGVRIVPPPVRGSGGEASA